MGLRDIEMILHSDLYRKNSHLRQSRNNSNIKVDNRDESSMAIDRWCFVHGNCYNCVPSSSFYHSSNVEKNIQVQAIEHIGKAFERKILHSCWNSNRIFSRCHPSSKQS